MNKPTIFYFGTHEFGAYILEALIKSDSYVVKKVFTQPDRPIGRKHVMTKAAVKLVAEKYNLPIEQPETLKNFALSGEKPNFNIVCQYGLIIPKNILDFCNKSSINVHTSLLPKYRGASPIQTVLIYGETVTGVTIMLMDEKMDRGAILSQAEVQIDPTDDYLSLSKKMEPIASALLLETLPKWIDGEIKSRVQDESEATFCKLFSRDDGMINWDKSADKIYNLFRGLNPWPGIWTLLEGKRLKLLSIKPSTHDAPKGMLTFDDDNILIGTTNGSVQILELQLEGSKPMNAKVFANGFGRLNGKQLG